MPAGRIIFMLEEPSMAEFLRHFVPRLFPNWNEGENFLCIPHEGKSDLEKSLPRKLRAWADKQDRFVVIRDNDSADCVSIKHRLSALCAQNSKPDTLIRIACQELEAWYLGDLPAINAAFGARVDSQPNRKRYQNPDRLSQPSTDMKKLVSSFQKLSGARLLAAKLVIESNQSESFNQFVSGLRRYASETVKKST